MDPFLLKADVCAGKSLGEEIVMQYRSGMT